MVTSSTSVQHLTRFYHLDINHRDIWTLMCVHMSRLIFLLVLLSTISQSPGSHHWGYPERTRCRNIWEGGPAAREDMDHSSPRHTPGMKKQICMKRHHTPHTWSKKNYRPVFHQGSQRGKASPPTAGVLWSISLVIKSIHYSPSTQTFTVWWFADQLISNQSPQTLTWRSMIGWSLIHVRHLHRLLIMFYFLIWCIC